MTDLVPIRFIQHHVPYSAGEIAGFTPAQADFMVNDLKVAEIYKPKSPSPSSNPASAPTAPPAAAPAPSLEDAAVTKPVKAGAVQKRS